MCQPPPTREHLARPRAKRARCRIRWAGRATPWRARAPGGRRCASPDAPGTSLGTLRCPSVKQMLAIGRGVLAVLVQQLLMNGRPCEPLARAGKRTLRGRRPPARRYGSSGHREDSKPTTRAVAPSREARDHRVPLGESAVRPSGRRRVAKAPRPGLRRSRIRPGPGRTRVSDELDDTVQAFDDLAVVGLEAGEVWLGVTVDGDQRREGAPEGMRGGTLDAGVSCPAVGPGEALE
jgi:hypothetical protein